MRWLSAALAVVSFWLAAWIWIPAPTYFLLTFSVGAPEVSHWLIVAALIAMAMAARELSSSRLALATFAVAAVALVLSLTVWLRVRGTIARFDAATKDLRAEPAAPLRRTPIVFGDLFRGIPAREARITRGIAFKEVDGKKLALDVYRPTHDGTFPIIVQIYGGAWRGGEPSDFTNFATRIASSGYVVFAIDYRLAPTYRWPTQIDDVDDALRWIAAHAAEYGGDASKIVLIGRSAGAHLATHAAWFTSPVPIRGVVSFYGPVDLVTSYENPPRPDPIGVRTVEEGLIGGPLDAMRDRYADASTISHLRMRKSPVPPTLLIYGHRDHIVEAKYGVAVAQALAQTGTPVAYLEIPWADHAFDAVFNGPSSQIATYYTERFLAWATR